MPPSTMRTKRRRLLTSSISALTLLSALAAGCRAAAGGGESLAGSRLQVLAGWSGAEEKSFLAVLSAFESRTGVSVTYTSVDGDISRAVDSRLTKQQPLDVAFLPQPGLLRQYAISRRLVPLDRFAGKAIAENYPPAWRALEQVRGRSYGVWFKAANKSLIWYNIGAFEQAGVVPPQNIDGLLRVARTFTVHGLAAFAVGGRDRWTLTDWFENTYLRSAGGRRYDMLAAHRIPWTDPSVQQALTLLSRLLAPRLLLGGTAGALSATFTDSVIRTFARPPVAAMTCEGDFVANFIRGSTSAEIGVDADVFPFPAIGESPPDVMGGGDAAVLFRDSPAGRALMRYLASPEAGSVWAARGGFISPNINVDLAVYPDPISRAMARDLLDAGDGFHFDLSDQQPAAFGENERSGMGAILAGFLRSGNVARTAVQLETAARAARSGGPHG